MQDVVNKGLGGEKEEGSFLGHLNNLLADIDKGYQTIPQIKQKLQDFKNTAAAHHAQDEAALSHVKQVI